MEGKKKVALYDIIFDGVVIYVGVTINLKHRFCGHTSIRTFPRTSKMQVVEWYESKTVAFKAEKARIAELKPPLNIPLYASRKVRKEIEKKRKELFKREAVIEAEIESERWRKAWEKINNATTT